MPSARLRKACPPLTQAVEPRGYDRRFYALVLTAGLILILLAAGILAYYELRTRQVTPGIGYDLGSLFMHGHPAFPDAANPCILLQDHLEATRTRLYETAYGQLCAGLKSEVSLERFEANCRDNEQLFRQVSGYSFPSYEDHGTSALAKGFIDYRGGGRSRVEAALAREGAAWRIAQMQIIYQ